MALDGLPAFELYWGKARPGETSARCHLLSYHCMDVAAVGLEALQRLPGLRAMFARRLGLADHLIEPWIAFWPARHDPGKSAESFQSQCPNVFEWQRGRPPNPAKPYTLRHDSLGMLFWKGVLRDQVIDQAWFGARSEDLADGLDWWAHACTGHHGQPPTEGDHWRQHQDQTLSLADYWQQTQRQAAQALDASGVMPPPSAREMLFKSLFAYISTPSPLQQWASKTPFDTGPQIHLLEDVTGAGKTEAALMLTHRLMATGCGDRPG